ncbi:hypothetical protein ACHAWU_010410 [Discostella pseudostelligera]|uniref:Major facilitator superfamily (MFS) profile domain-containing protein n=1 Tax=Discostella pseudostelligera TaxID=259834 RepID=A0ABD3LZ04_9STRA
MSSSGSNRSERRRLLGLAFIAIMANGSYTTIAPILPLEMDKYYISEVYVSIVFLAFTFGSLLAPALFAGYFEKLGRIHIISYCMVGMSIMFWCLGHVFDMADTLSAWNNNDNSHYELVVSGFIFIIQFALGAFYAMITTGYYSLASLAFVEKEVAMSVVESSVGIGHIVGPIVGSVLYDEQGYQFVYISGVALSMLAAAFVSWRFLVPIFEGKATDIVVGDAEIDVERCKSVDSSKSEKHLSDSSASDDDELNSECSRSVESAEREIVTGYQSMNIQMIQDDKPAKRLSALSLLEFPVILLAACSICWAMVTWAFLEPLLAKQLDNAFNVGNKGIGIIFSLTSIVYVPATLLVQYIPSSIGRRKTIFISLLLTPIVVLLVGSNSLPLVVVGVGLLGLIPAPVWVMLLPWMQDETVTLFPDPDTKLKANDLIASIYNSFMTLGKVVGYTIGSLSSGFARTTQTVALLISVHSILFYFGTRERKTSHRIQAFQSTLC